MRCSKPRQAFPDICIQVCGQMGSYLVTLTGGVVIMLATFLFHHVHLLHGASHLIVGFWSFFNGLALITRCCDPHAHLRPSQLFGLHRLLSCFSFIIISALYVTLLTFLITDIRSTGLASIKASIDSMLQDHPWIVESQDGPQKSMWMLAYVDTMGIFVSFLSMLALCYPKDPDDADGNVTLNRVSMLSTGWVYESNASGTSMIEHDVELNSTPKPSPCKEAFCKFRIKQGPRSLSTARLLTQSPSEEENNSLNTLKTMENESDKGCSFPRDPKHDEIRSQREYPPSEVLVSDLPSTCPVPYTEEIGSCVITGRSPVEKLSSFKPFATCENNTSGKETTVIPLSIIKNPEDIKNQKSPSNINSSSASKSLSKTRKGWKISSIRSRKHGRKHTKSEDAGLKFPQNGNHEHQNYLSQKQTPPHIPPRIDSRTHYSPPAGIRPELLRWTESGNWPTPALNIPDIVPEASNKNFDSPREPEPLQSAVAKTKRYGCLPEVRNSGSGTEEPLQSAVAKTKRYGCLPEVRNSGSGTEHCKVDNDSKQIRINKEVSFSTIVDVEDQDQDHDRQQVEHSLYLTKIKTTKCPSNSQNDHKNSIYEATSVSGGHQKPPKQQQQDQQQQPENPQMSHNDPDSSHHSAPISFDQELRDRLKQRRTKHHNRATKETKHTDLIETHRASTPSRKSDTTAFRPPVPQKPPRRSTKSRTPPVTPTDSLEVSSVADTSVSTGFLTKQVNEAFSSILALQSSYTSSSHNSDSPCH